MNTTNEMKQIWILGWCHEFVFISLPPVLRYFTTIKLETLGSISLPQEMLSSCLSLVDWGTLSQTVLKQEYSGAYDKSTGCLTVLMLVDITRVTCNHMTDISYHS